MDGVGQIDCGIVVEKASAGFAKVDRAFADFVPTLGTHHHLAGGAALSFDRGDCVFSRAGNAIIFRKQSALNSGPHRLAFLLQLGQFCGIPCSPTLRPGSFVGEGELLVSDGFMQHSLPRFERFGFDQDRELKLFNAIDFQFAEGDLVFERLCLAVALHAVQLRAITGALQSQLVRIQFHPVTRQGLVRQRLPVLLKFATCFRERSFPRGNLPSVLRYLRTQCGGLVFDILEMREFG